MFEDLLSDDSGNPVDILKMLMSGDDIHLKTENDIEQIAVQMQLFWFELQADPQYEDKHPFLLFSIWLKRYNELKVSKDRQGRKEIIKGLTESKQFQQEEVTIAGKPK